jgi:hypothetical protein
MARAGRDHRRRALVTAILVSGLLVAPPVAAEIYKCATKDGMPRYQNFPCDIDSLGLKSNPSVASTPSNLPVATPPSIPGASQEKPKTGPANAPSTDKSGNAGEPAIGMTEDEVKALLGEPEDVVEDEPRSGGRVSNWRYGDGRIVQFDSNRRVLGVQR